MSGRIFPYSNTHAPCAGRDYSMCVYSQTHSILPGETWIQDVRVVDIQYIRNYCESEHSWTMHLLLPTRLKSSGLELEPLPCKCLLSADDQWIILTLYFCLTSKLFSGVHEHIYKVTTSQCFPVLYTVWIWSRVRIHIYCSTAQ